MTKFPHSLLHSTHSLLWIVLLLNVFVWLPFGSAIFPTIGLGHDSQLFTPAIHALLRAGNMPWDLMTRFAETRVDIFSYPYFSIIYPFYWTLGIDGKFTYDQHLMMDASSVIFHMVVASMLFALFLQRVGCRVSVSALGGIAYAYAMHMKMWSSWVWAVSAFAWIPLCLLGVWEIVVEKRRRRGVLFLGVGFGLITLGTGLGLAYSLVFSGTLALALWLKDASSVKEMLLDVRAMVVGGVLGAGIGAAHILPVVARMHDYIRWYSGGHLVGKFKPPYEGTLAPALDWPSGIIQLVAPLKLSGSLGNLYIGGGLVLLASLLLFMRSPWRRFSIVLWVVSIYFLLDALGDATFIHQITYNLPLLGSIRYPLASVVVPVVLLTFMAFLALEYLLRIHDTRKSEHLRWTLLFYLGVVVSIVVLPFIDSGKLYQNIWQARNYFLYPIAAAGIVSFILTLAVRNKRWVRFLPLVVLAFYLPQYTMLHHPKVPIHEAALYNQCDGFVNLDQALRTWRSEVPDNTRLAVLLTNNKLQGCLGKRRLSSQLIQSLAVMSGWSVMQQYFSPRPYYEWKLLSKLSAPRALGAEKELLKAGISHVLTTTMFEKKHSVPPYYVEKGRVGQFILYEIQGWETGQDVAGCVRREFRRPFIVTEKGSRPIELPKKLNSPTFSRLQCDGDEPDLASLEANIVKKVSNGGISYQLRASRPLLFVSDRIFRDDWVVRLNGETVTPIKVDGYRMALVLEEGPQKIEFSHWPTDFVVGLFITLLGVLLSIWLAVLEWKSRGNNRQTSLV